MFQVPTPRSNMSKSLVWMMNPPWTQTPNKEIWSRKPLSLTRNSPQMNFWTNTTLLCQGHWMLNMTPRLITLEIMIFLTLRKLIRTKG